VIQVLAAPWLVEAAARAGQDRQRALAVTLPMSAQLIKVAERSRTGQAHPGPTPSGVADAISHRRAAGPEHRLRPRVTKSHRVIAQ
jgi:hypothetical protein